AAGQAEGDDGIGDAVHDEHPEGAQGGQGAQPTTSPGDGPVEGQDSGKPLGGRQPQPVGQGCAFAEPGEIDALRVDMVVAPRLLDGAQHIFFDRCIAGTVLSPAVAAAAVGPGPDALGAAQADADVVAPTQTRRQAEYLFLVPAW